MARRKKKQVSPQQAAPAPENVPGPACRPRWCRAIAGLGGAYIVVAASFFFLPDASASGVGAICGDGCGGVSLFGLPLESYGLLLMAAILLTHHTAGRKRDDGWEAAFLLLAGVHGGASLGFAASQWLGVAPVCWLCQVAAFLSLAVAVAAFREAAPAFRFPRTAALQALLIGVLAVPAAWGELDGLPGQDPGSSTAGGASAESGQEGNFDDFIPPVSLGDEDAPFTLVVLSDLDCPVCERFEVNQLPELIENAVEPGKLRIDMVLTASSQAGPEARRQMITAMALAKAGASIPEMLDSLRGPTLHSVPQGVRLYPREEVQERAMDYLREVDSGDWTALIRQQEELDRMLRERYLDGQGGTPSFVLKPNDPAFERWPAPEDVYSFHGYQLADPMLEFINQ